MSKLTAKNFHSKLKSYDHDWDSIAQRWLHSVYPDFSPTKSEFVAPNEVKRDKDYNALSAALGRVGFSTSYRIRTKILREWESPYIIKIHIPPQGE